MEQYQKYHKAQCDRVESLELTEERLASLRVVFFCAAVACAVLLSWWTSIFGAIGFVVAWLLHTGTRRELAGAQTQKQFAERLLRRTDGRWVQEPHAGERFKDPDHPYALDLDLFGRYSVFQRLSLCVTTGGESRLAGWLMQPPKSADQVRYRQKRVGSLCDLVEFRNKLATSIPAERSTRRLVLDVDPWLNWSRSQVRLRYSRLPLLAFNLFALVGAYVWVTGLSAAVLVAALASQSMFAWLYRQQTAQVTAAIDDKAAELWALLPALSVVESSKEVLPEEFARRSLTAPVTGPVRRLCVLTELLDSRRNPFFAPIALCLLWTPHVALSIARWRTRHSRHLAEWLDLMFELEALNSLAAYAFENPSDVLPELVSEQTLRFEGVSHPLLLDPAKTSNDVELTNRHPVILLSGSNMSGKSTLLRAIGVNSVLAYIGLPVRATACSLSVFQLGCTIKIEDSLHEGRSRFYAELIRLKRIVDLSAQGPVLALVDEVLSGTNSLDRTVGAKAVMASLLKHGAFVVVTTHDLALMDLEAADTRVRNFHFADQCVGSELHFDYQLRSGRLTGSSARALMTSLGFDLAD